MSESIIQERREYLLEGMKAILEHDVNEFGGSPLSDFGISADEIWASILGLATADDAAFVGGVLDIFIQTLLIDPKMETPHTRWFARYLTEWVDMLVKAKEIETAFDFPDYYGAKFGGWGDFG